MKHNLFLQKSMLLLGFFLFFGAFATKYLFAQSLSSQDSATNSLALRPGTGIELSSFGRDLLKYVARCALPAGVSLQLKHDDTQDTVQGAFALASDWQTQPLSEAGKRWVSACLLANVNAFGEHVLVSFRASHLGMASTVTDEERNRFPAQEGAFYGNLFSDPPIAYACKGEGKDFGPSRQKRVCTDATNSIFTRCDMILTGTCTEVCTSENVMDHYVTHCKGGDQIFDEVVTTFLPRQ